MPHVRVETSVPRHRKFVKAGPAPSWLWLCGNCYCQDSLTDGFIPEDALPYLGVKNAKQLAQHLVAAGLWDEVAGGWQVHDYLDHNRSAAQIADLRASRANGGKEGGRPKQNLPQNLPDTLKVSHGQPTRETFPVLVPVDVDVVGSDLKKEKPFDQWFGQLHAAYPPKSVSRGPLAEQAFVRALVSHGTPEATFTVMLLNLDTQKRGAQWLSGKVPRLDRWLSEGLWEQRHDAPTVTERTAGTLAAAAEILRGEP